MSTFTTDHDETKSDIFTALADLWWLVKDYRNDIYPAVAWQMLYELMGLPESYFWQFLMWWVSGNTESTINNGSLILGMIWFAGLYALLKLVPERKMEKSIWLRMHPQIYAKAMERSLKHVTQIGDPFLIAVNSSYLSQRAVEYVEDLVDLLWQVYWSLFARNLYIVYRIGLLAAVSMPAAMFAIAVGIVGFGVSYMRVTRLAESPRKLKDDYTEEGKALATKLIEDYISLAVAGFVDYVMQEVKDIFANKRVAAIAEELDKHLSIRHSGLMRNVFIVFALVSYQLIVLADLASDGLVSAEDVAKFVLCVSLASNLFTEAWTLGWVFNSIVRQSHKLRKHRLLLMQQSVWTIPSTPVTSQNWGSKPLGFKGWVIARARNYHLGKPNTIDVGATILNAYVDIPAGKQVALVGATGAGKTTLARILMGRLQPDSDSTICVNGINMLDIDPRCLHKLAAVVLQEATVYNGTIRTNLVPKGMDVSDEVIFEALEFAQLKAEVIAWGGLDREVGERGLKLSGGERARLNLARAFIRIKTSKVPIQLVVVDEATAALDNKTEEHIRNALLKLTAGITTIYIAHRLSTIQHCDLIMVMDGGEVIQEGTHDDLVARPGKYQELYLASQKK
jgi:ABC-type multidrug transport system fused ATPase/permease subunit